MRIIWIAGLALLVGMSACSGSPDDDDVADDDDADDDGADDDIADDDAADDDAADDDTTADDDDTAGDDDTWEPWGGDPVPGDFTLLDVNPNSATLGQSFTLSGHVGHLGLIYFAYGTCHACAENAAALQQHHDDHPDWGDTVQIWFLECPWCTVAYDGLVDDYFLPELQDTDEAGVWDTWGVEKGFAYLIHFDGTIYQFDDYFSESDAAALVDVIETLLAPAGA